MVSGVVWITVGVVFTFSFDHALVGDLDSSVVVLAQEIVIFTRLC